MRMPSIALAAALLLPASAFAAPKIGAPAPAFELKDVDGKTRSLAELKGKIVVLEWTNDGCPYVKKHYETGNMQRLQSEAQKDGVVWVVINSSSPGKQGHVDGDGAKKVMAKHKASPSMYLLDPDGKVGMAYGAQTTPHMYVIDKEGTLRYMGAIDDKPTTDKADVKTATNYVTAALAAVKANKPVEKPVTRAYGCTVKYPG